MVVYRLQCYRFYMGGALGGKCRCKVLIKTIPAEGDLNLGYPAILA